MTLIQSMSVALGVTHLLSFQPEMVVLVDLMIRP